MTPSVAHAAPARARGPVRGQASFMPVALLLLAVVLAVDVLLGPLGLGLIQWWV